MTPSSVSLPSPDGPETVRSVGLEARSATGPPGEHSAENLAPDNRRPDLPKRCQSHYAGLQCAFVLAHDHPHGNEDSGVYVTWGRMASEQQPTVGTVIPEAWQHALDDLWGCIGKREIEHLQPETMRLAKENHEALWHNHDGPVCFGDGLPWDHPHHFATVKSPNE